MLAFRHPLQLTKSLNHMKKELRRDPNNKIIAGVCSGIAKYLDIDPVIIRLIWAAAIFLFGTGFLFYIICWIIIPEESKW